MSSPLDGLEPYVDPRDADELEDLAWQLDTGRPVPRPGFRAQLRSRLCELERRGPAGSRPQRLGRLIAGYAVSGSLLLAIAAVGLTGAGPLGF